jgi:hypothetical protein
VRSVGEGVAPVDTDRAVLIRYQRDGQPRRGSGLRIGGRFVLTADHCANGTDHRVVVGGQEFPVPATVHARSESAEVDVAVLLAPALPEGCPPGPARRPPTSPGPPPPPPSG